MSPSNSVLSQSSSPTRFWLAIIFFFSGVSSLIYQVSWQRMLTVYYGSGMVSVALIVSIYMFGLGVGALLGGYFAEKIKDRVKLYCLVELGIGFIGVLSLPVLQFLGQHTAGSPYWIAGCYQFLFLSLPTILMGMTLPLLTKIFNRLLANFSKTVSVLYFVNTLGAAFGAILGSYVLISFGGLDNAIEVAVGINLTLALLIILRRQMVGHSEEVLQKFLAPDPDSGKKAKGQFYWFVFIAGFLAIGYEIVWFRVITVLVKPSAYTFSSILAVYLIGIALGSFLMGRLLDKFPLIEKRNLFLSLQVMIAVCVAGLLLAYYYLTLNTSFLFLTKLSFSIPVHPPPEIFSHSWQINTLKRLLVFIYWAGDIFFWSTFFMLMPTILMGASFPLICALALEKDDQEASTIGRTYFLNILGNVLGSLGTGFFLLPVLGTERTFILFILMGGLFSLGLKTLNLFKRIGIIFAIILLLIWFPKKGQLYALMHTPPGTDYQAYFEEGLEGVVMTYQSDTSVVNYINGHSHGGRPGYTFYTQVIEVASVAAAAKNILVIGYGTGSITEAALKIPGVDKVTVIEINETLMRNLQKIPLFQDLLSTPRLDMVFDDGRRFLMRSNKKFDLIFMSPLRTTTAYANNLYSRQFFQLAAKHLTPQGILVAWTDEYEVMPQTLASVFADIHLYLFKPEGFIFASATPIGYQSHNWSNIILNRFSAYDHKMILVTKSKLRRLKGPRLLNYLKDFPINQDWRPVSEYYIGRELLKRKVFNIF